MKPFYKIQLNHGQPVNKQSVAMLTWLGVGILSIAIVMIELQQINHQIGQLQSRVNQEQFNQTQSMRMTSEMLSLQGKENAGKRDEMNAVQLAITELNTPWNTLFTMLESLKSRRVRLLTVEPNPKQHKLRLTAESATTEDMFGYVAALSKQSLLSHVSLLTHERSEDGRELPISFVIEATWQG